MENYTIAEDFILPSLGKIYGKEINPSVKLRSMTTEDEMKRLGKSERPNELFAEILDSCIVGDLGIKAYDLCAPDFQYLTHKLRVVTYGADYPIVTVCPVCFAKNEMTINLDQLPVKHYSEDLGVHLKFELPITKKQIELRLQTPRMIDDSTIKSKEYSNRSSIKGDSAILFTIISAISKIDGKIVDEFKLENFIKKLPMKDTNCILKHLQKTMEFGLDTKVNCKCNKCNADYVRNMPISGEFFGPTGEGW